MEYVTCKKFSGLSLSGQTTIASGKAVQCIGGVLIDAERPICYATSQNAYDHFARDDDGEGRKRFSLTHGILAAVAKAKTEYNGAVAEVMAEKIPNEEKAKKIAAIPNKPAEFFDGVNADPVFRTMMKNGVWNALFYNAGIEQLERLSALAEEVL